ncbi:MAG: sulfotransferase domain-containing protein [Microcoleaceae cyanobacterium]
MESDISKHCIIIGGMKCGTTSLFHSLSKNCPSINPSKVKDTKFFVAQDRGVNWEKGIDWYLEMFRVFNGIKLEASTHYTKYPDYPGVPARIRQVLKNVKLIYLVRDPLQRSISHFFHNLLVDGEQLDINEELSTIRNKYINYSDYSLQLSQYYDYFKPEDILIINIVEEEYREKSLESLKHFLGIEISNSFILDRSNTLKGNFVKAKKNIKIEPDIINSSENDIELALKFGLSHENLRKIIHLCTENAVKFQKTYPFSIDNWLDNYKAYFL